MKSVTGFVIALLVLAVAIPTHAQEPKKRKKNNAANAQPQAITQLMKALEKAEPSAEQKEKIKAVVAKHKEKLVDLQKKRQELLGAETIKAMNEARKAATAEGKKGKQLAEAVRDAAGLSEEKASELEELTKVTQAATVALKKDVLAILSEEQREKSGITLPTKKSDAPKKKKANADK